MDRAETPDEKGPSIPTVVLDHDDEPGPPTELSATKECVDEISASNQHPESPCHKVWAQHSPPSDADPAASAVQSEEKDVYLDVSEVEAIMSKPDHKITVRILRRILSIMMVILYKTDTEIANKRKMKSLWDRRPEDWPANVPFKDPNNGVKLQNGRHGQKPVHKELLQMYQFLKKKYQREVRILTTEESANVPAVPSYQDIKQEPFSPVTPKLEPVSSLPHTLHTIYRRESGPVVIEEPVNSYSPESGPIVLREEPMNRASPSSTPTEITPQVIAPDGMDVRVEYVAVSAQPPSPDAGRLHHVLEAQYQRLVEHFSQVQNLVNAYNPPAADDFEKMGKELECLLEETRNQPERFSLIFNDIGHKVESFLSKVQLMHISYVTNPHFAKECQALAAEIKSRTKAALSVPVYQAMQVGMVLDPNPHPAVLSTIQNSPMSPSQDVMSVVTRRVAFQRQPSTQDDKKKEGVHKITEEDLATSINALGPQEPEKLEMTSLWNSLSIIKEHQVPPSTTTDTDTDETKLKMQMEECSDECIPTTDEVIDDVLGLESEYGCCAWSPTSVVTDLPSPDTPRYIAEDPAILSLHQGSPYPADIADAMVVVDPNLVNANISSRGMQQDGKENDSSPAEASSLERPAVPLTVVSMETDHEEDHFDLVHHGVVEEV